MTHYIYNHEHEHDAEMNNKDFSLAELEGTYAIVTESFQMRHSSDRNKHASVFYNDMTYEEAKTWVQSTFVQYNFMADKAIQAFQTFPGLAGELFSIPIPRCGASYCQMHHPIFAAILYSLELFQVIYEAFPDAVQRLDSSKATLLHEVVFLSASIDIVSFTIQKYPEAVKMMNCEGLPIHSLMQEAIQEPKSWRNDIISVLLDKYPESMFVEKMGTTPFDDAIRIGDINILELFVNKCPSNSDFLSLDLSRDSIYSKLSTDQALLLVKVLSKFSACYLYITQFPNCELFAATMISELQHNTSLKSIELALPDTSCELEEINLHFLNY